jgi:hypothetical protein
MLCSPEHGEVLTVSVETALDTLHLGFHPGNSFRPKRRALTRECEMPCQILVCD